MPGRFLNFESSDQEDSVTKSTIGFSYMKRNLAFQFGVDPYSSNPVLQDELNELAWIAFTADLAPQVGYFFMPAGAILWMTFSATRWTSYLDEQVREFLHEVRTPARSRPRQIGEDGRE